MGKSYGVGILRVITKLNLVLFSLFFSAGGPRLQNHNRNKQVLNPNEVNQAKEN